MSKGKTSLTVQSWTEFRFLLLHYYESHFLTSEEQADNDEWQGNTVQHFIVYV